MFKKLVCALLAMMMLFSFTACGNDEDEQNVFRPTGTPSIQDDYYQNDATATVPNATAINPFDGVSYTVSGVSPYCQISVNTQNCSKEIQNYIKFTTDKKAYANGEEAVITAELLSRAPEDYKLTNSTQTYEIINQPEYITSVEEVDLSLLKSQINDKLTSEISMAIGAGDGFGTDAYCLVDSKQNPIHSYKFVSVSPELKKSYICSLKGIKQENFNSRTAFNYYAEIYDLFLTVEVNGKNYTGHLFVCISAANIIQNPDNTIEWGGQSQYDLVFSAVSQTSVNEAVNICITSNSENYNISEINN